MKVTVLPFFDPQVVKKVGFSKAFHYLLAELIISNGAICVPGSFTNTLTN